MTGVNFPLTASELEALIDSALNEDVGSGDITAKSTVPETARLVADAVARQELIVAGLPIAEAIFKRLEPDSEFKCNIKDGAQVSNNEAIFTISGSARALLTAERTALNFLQHLSGISTLTRAYVTAIKGTNVRILDTRKTIPGLRMLAKYAVRMGGGYNHRIGLFDSILIKDNHIAIAGSVESAIKSAIGSGYTEVQVECDTLDQVKKALESGATRLLLDNMSVCELKLAVEVVANRVPLEASGGVNLETVREIAETGVDYISVGRLTQSAPAVDIGLDYRSA